MSPDTINELAQDATKAIEDLRAGALAMREGLDAASRGNWIAAEDVQRLARELDVLMNGEEGAAKAPALCDVVAQARTVLVWIPVEERMPPSEKFVLVKCPSGYSTTPFVYTTARRSAHRPGRWIDHANDSLLDWGMEPTHWREPPL